MPTDLHSEIIWNPILVAHLLPVFHQQIKGTSKSRFSETVLRRPLGRSDPNFCGKG